MKGVGKPKPTRRGNELNAMNRQRSVKAKGPIDPPLRGDVSNLNLPDLRRFRCFGGLENGTRLGDILGSPMHQQNVLVRLKGGFVLDNLILGHPDGREGRTQGAHKPPTTTAPSSVPTRAATRGPAIATNSQSRKYKDCRSQQQTPQTSPERPRPAPGLDLVDGGIEADGMFLTVIALADQREFLHIEAGTAQQADGFLCLDVCCRRIPMIALFP